MDRNTIISSLENSYVELRNLYIAIQDANDEGRQFDFVSYPRLSQVVDRLKATINHINCIVYQEKQGGSR